MKTIVIENLTIDTELDRQALASVHGRRPVRFGIPPSSSGQSAAPAGS